MVAPGAKKPSLKLPAEKEAYRIHNEMLLAVEEQFHEFDVVWAKVPGFPWWPGVLFFSWSTVHAAGVKVGVKTELPIPGPEKVPVLDPATGKETGVFRTQRHCLIMFLDKFNFSVVPVDSRCLGSFTTHYQLHSHAILGSKKNPKKGEFRRALAKASELLHMGQEYTEEDLVLLDKPAPVEKKRRLQLSDEDVESLEDAWDDHMEEESAEFSVSDAVSDNDYEEMAVAKPRRRQPSSAASRNRTETKSKTSSSRRRSSSTQRTTKADKMLLADDKGASRGKRSKSRARKHEAAGNSDNGDGERALVSAKAHRKSSVAPPKEPKSKVRKASWKEGRHAAHVAVVSPSASPIDLTGTPDTAEKKPRDVKPRSQAHGRTHDKKKSRKKPQGMTVVGHHKHSKQSRPKMVVLGSSEDEADKRVELISGSGDEEQEQEQREKMLTPLASIWTDHAPTTGSSIQLAYQQDFVWDDTVFTDELGMKEKEAAAAEQELAIAGEGRERPLSKRQSRSVQQAQIRRNLMMGNLDPHTMVQCTAYRSRDQMENPSSRSRGAPTLAPPFEVVVHPDAVFVSDLHAHLATCEIIGFLGGKWDEATKTLYIQAAFPCRSLMIDGDDGSTDVEMDPESEIELRGIIQNAHLEVVGWYHSHPAFAPDPSVRDIENQASYQQLFQRCEASKGGGEKKEVSEPFVGLIVGTYDTRRDTPVSLFRYFNVRGEQVSGGARREIYMPYELIPARRHFRSVLDDEARHKIKHWPMYPSVLTHFGLHQRFAKMPSLPTDGALAKVKTLKPLSNAVKAQAPERKVKQNSEEPASERKRKQSSEAPGGKPPKKVKGKRERKHQVKPEIKPEAVYQIDLTVEDNEAIAKDKRDSGTLKASPKAIDAKAKEEQSSAQELQTPETSVTPPKVATKVAQASSASSMGALTLNGEKNVEMEAVGESALTSLAERLKATGAAPENPSESRTAASDPSAFAAVISSKDNRAPSTTTIDDPGIKADEPPAVNVIAKESEKLGAGGGNVAPSAASSASRLVVTVNEAPVAVEPEVVQVVADVVISTAAAVVSKRKNKRKSQEPHRLVSAAQSDDMRGEESARSREMQKMTQEMGLKRHAETLDTSSRRKIRNPTKLEVSTDGKVKDPSAESRQVEAANAATADKLLHTPTIPTRPGVSPSASTSSSGSSGRRRNRKPQKTVKKTQWTSSPRDDRSSQRKTPTSSIPLGQALDDVFQTQGPRFSGEKTYQLTPTSTVVNTPKRDPHLFDDDVEYIYVEEDVNTTPSREENGKAAATPLVTTSKPTVPEIRAPSKLKDVAKEKPRVSSSDAPSTSEDAQKAGDRDPKEVAPTNPEVQVFVTSVVGQVVTECIPRVAAATVEKLKQQALDESKASATSAPAKSASSAVESEEKSAAMKSEKEDMKVESVVGVELPQKKTDAPSGGEPPVIASSSMTMKGEPIKQAIDGSESEAKTSVKKPASMEINIDGPRSKKAGSVSKGDKTFASATTEKPSFSAIASTKEEQSASSGVAVKPLTAASIENGAPASVSVKAETKAGVCGKSSSHINGVAIKEGAQSSTGETAKTMSTPALPTLFGSNCECEDIQTSLEKMGRHLDHLKEAQDGQLKLESASSILQDSKDAKKSTSASSSDVVKNDAAAKIAGSASEQNDARTLEQMHLNALRSRYGAGVSSCVAQVITLVDYYRDFGRRTALDDTWKPRISKLAKIEASLSEYVNYLNLPVVMRQDFVKDIIGYLRLSWGATTQRRRMPRLGDRSTGSQTAI